MNSLRTHGQLDLFGDVCEDVSRVPEVNTFRTPLRKGLRGQERSLTFTAVVQEDSRVPSELWKRRRTYQFGSLQREHRKRTPDVWVFRYSQIIDGKKIRR